MTSPPSRRARLTRRLFVNILSPAVIGGIFGFLATHAVAHFEAQETAKFTSNLDFEKSIKLEDDKRIDVFLEKIDGMPNVTSADVEARISFLQQKLENLRTDFGRNRLYTKIESLRGSRNAKLEAERKDTERKANEEIAKRAIDDAVKQKQARDAADAAASAAAAARREAMLFDRAIQRAPR
jgi:TolA-binding protein